MRVPSMDEIMEVAQSRGAFSEAPWLWNGLAGAWPLQEGAGVVVKDVAGTNDGLLQNMDPATSWTRGQLGRAMFFSGSPRYVSLRDVPVVWPPFSVVAWIRYTSTVSHLGIVNTFSGADSAWSLSVRGVFPQAFCFRWYNTSGGDGALRDTPGYTLPINVWHQLGVTYPGGSGKSITLYQNGVVAPTGQWVGDGSNLRVPDNATIGRGVSYFIGDIAHVLIYKRILSASEVRELYADPWAMYRLRRRVSPVPRIPAFIKRRSLGLRAGSREAVI